LLVLGRVVELAKEPDLSARLAEAKTSEDFLCILADKST
jgi:hypothetical protein